MERTCTPECLAAFEQHLRNEEKSRSTLQYYLRDVRQFMEWLGGRPVSKEEAVAYKEKLETEGYKPPSINTMLAALNSFFHFAGWEDCHVKSLHTQQASFCAEDRELDREDYEKLVETAMRQGDVRMALLMETLCGTGIRISELRFITAEAVRKGVAYVTNKGKTRPVIIEGALQEALYSYIRQRKIKRGPVFITRNGQAMDRSNIWKALKRLCVAAGVDPYKVFPHNFRHLFARIFYELEKDIAKLADVLGHTSINTTRRYIISTWKEHRAQLARMNVILFDSFGRRKKRPPDGGADHVIVVMWYHYNPLLTQPTPTWKSEKNKGKGGAGVQEGGAGGTSGGQSPLFSLN